MPLSSKISIECDSNGLFNIESNLDESNIHVFSSLFYMLNKGKLRDMLLEKIYTQVEKETYEKLLNILEQLDNQLGEVFDKNLDKPAIEPLDFYRRAQNNVFDE